MRSHRPNLTVAVLAGCSRLVLRKQHGSLASQQLSKENIPLVIFYP